MKGRRESTDRLKKYVKLFKRIKIEIITENEKPMHELYNNIDIKIVKNDFESLWNNIKIIIPVSQSEFETPRRSKSTMMMDTMQNITKRFTTPMSSFSMRFPTDIKIPFRKSELQLLYEKIIINLDLKFEEMMNIEHYQKLIKYFYNILRIHDIKLNAYTETDRDTLRRIEEFSSYKNSEIFDDKNDRIHQDVVQIHKISPFILESLMIDKR